RRWSASISSGTRRSHNSRGTGPKSAPASDRNVPACTSATVVPPPKSARQSTASLIDTLVRGASARPVGLDAASALLEVLVERRRSWLRLALVLRSETLGSVRSLNRARHPEEADLPDPHPVVQGDRQVRHVRQLERQIALPARVDIAGSGVNQEPQPPKRTFAFQAGDQVV